MENFTRPPVGPTEHFGRPDVISAGSGSDAGQDAAPSRDVGARDAIGTVGDGQRPDRILDALTAPLDMSPCQAAVGTMTRWATSGFVTWHDAAMCPICKAEAARRADSVPREFCADCDRAVVSCRHISARTAETP